jgi:hypothetical protein
MCGGVWHPACSLRKEWRSVLIRVQFVKSYHKPLSPDAFAKQFREDVRVRNNILSLSFYLSSLSEDGVRTTKRCEKRRST